MFPGQNSFVCISPDVRGSDDVRVYRLWGTRSRIRGHHGHVSGRPVSLLLGRTQGGIRAPSRGLSLVWSERRNTDPNGSQVRSNATTSDTPCDQGSLDQLCDALGHPRRCALLCCLAHHHHTPIALADLADEVAIWNTTLDCPQSLLRQSIYMSLYHSGNGRL